MRLILVAAVIAALAAAGAYYLNVDKGSGAPLSTMSPGVQALPVPATPPASSSSSQDEIDAINNLNFQ